MITLEQIKTAHCKVKSGADFPSYITDKLSNLLGDCAKSGIAKWTVRMDKMTCTYSDKSGNEILVEIVPTP